MNKTALFYEEAVAVTPQRHGGWSVDMAEGYAFSRSVNSVPVATAEFQRASREVPIVFAGEDGDVFPQAVLGLKDRENLFIDETGDWSGRYIPAFVRRYPFIFAVDEEQRAYTLCIDEGFVGCNQEGRGQALFADGEKPSPYLDKMLAFLKAYQVEHERTRRFCERLVALDLLEPSRASVSLRSGEKLALTGLKVVSRDRLKALGDADLLELARSGHLEHVYAHLASLESFGTMIDRLAAH